MGEPKTRALTYFLRRYARLYVVLSLIAAASAAIEAVSVAAIYPLLTLVLDARVEGGGRVLAALQGLVDAVPEAHRLAGVLGLFISVLLLNALLQFLKEWRSAATSGFVAYDVKQRLLRRFVGAPYAFFLGHKQGDLTYRLSTASANLSFALYLIASAFSYALTALFIIVVLTTIEWRVTAVMLVLGAVIFYANRAIARNVSAWTGRGKQAAASAELEIVQQFIVGAKEIAVAGMGHVWANAVRRAGQPLSASCTSRISSGPPFRS